MTKVEPIFVMTPAYPGAQIVHAETIDVPPVNNPVEGDGQEVQEVAPEDEYRPTAHVVQDDEPADDEKLPAGHNVQEDEPAAA